MGPSDIGHLHFHLQKGFDSVKFGLFLIDQEKRAFKRFFWSYKLLW